jgi:Flp pilus assembly protein TadB
VKYIALVLAGVVVGYLVVRLLLPTLLERGVVFLAVPILLIAILLFMRALRRTRSGS